MKKTPRKLTLSKETLRMLSDRDVETAAGAGNSGGSCPVCPVVTYTCHTMCGSGFCC